MSNSTNSSSAGGDHPTTSSVLASSPDVAVSIFFQAAGQAFSLTMQNAASNQQNLNSLNAAIVANALKTIGTAGGQ